MLQYDVHKNAFDKRCPVLYGKNFKLFQWHKDDINN